MAQNDTFADGIRILGLLNQLLIESVLAKTPEELVFRMLNRSAGLCRYDRALFFTGTISPKLKGISGQASVNSNSEKVEIWNRLISEMKEPEKKRVLSRDDFPESLHADWDSYIRKNEGSTVLWFPLSAWERRFGGLWFERWQGAQWHEQELQLLHSLVMGYGGGWERLHPKRPLLDRFQGLARKKRTMGTIFVVAALLLLIRLPLRVVAPCEVVPQNPFIVTAPLNGVVSEVRVNPGEKVIKGQLLFEYDRRTVLDELKVSREQVEIIESTLDRARMQAFADPQARSEIAILEHRLVQEKTRFKLAEYNVSKLEVRAEDSGVVVIADPEKWRGRPVSVGEKVLSVVDPACTEIQLWVPEDDNMTFDFKVPVRVLLNVFPESSMKGQLDYVGSEVITGPQRTASVLAEAQWIKNDPRVKIGLKGVCVLYGEKVSLAYWLFRKPWAALNAFFGL